ncbi:MAG: TolC family protein [Vampirovibrionales bacterium]|nr:TolC family protein [Vampirovibrionales bacterium]
MIAMMMSSVVSKLPATLRITLATGLLMLIMGGEGETSEAKETLELHQGRRSETLPSADTHASTEGVLSLQDVLALVTANHPKLYSADLERRIAGAKLLEKQGAFDPGISLETDYLRYNDFSKRGKVSETIDNDLSLNVLTRSGLKFKTGARYNNGQVKPPLYPTGDAGEYFMGVYMPLLRGFRINEKVAAERQAELGIPSADALYQQTRLEVLKQAADAYWRWVMAARKVDVARQVLALAEVRYQAIDARVKQGDLPDIDAIESQQEVQRRLGGLSKEVREVEKAALKLSQYLWQPGGKPSPRPEEAFAPKIFSAPSAFADEDWMEGRKIAIEKRPELKSLNLQKDITQVDVSLAKNMRLPVMDLFATPGADTGGNSVGFTIKTGVVLTIPLRQRTANGMLAAAQFKLQKLDFEQRLLLQSVLLEIDDAVSAIRAAYAQYDAALKELAMAKSLEEGERLRFDFGDSTLFLVNQRERATAEVAMKVWDIQGEYYRALLNFQAVTAQL